jgi:hypothetical protein
METEKDSKRERKGERDRVRRRVKCHPNVFPRPGVPGLGNCP